MMTHVVIGIVMVIVGFVGKTLWDNRHSRN